MGGRSSALSPAVAVVAAALAGSTARAAAAADGSRSSASAAFAAAVAAAAAAAMPAVATEESPPEVGLPEVLAEAVDAITEARALEALGRLSHDDLRRFPFDGVETLVKRGWWRAAKALVVASHGARMDFTAPVRRATQEVKREADVLLKWLDPKFAIPKRTPMATRWAQNTTAVMIAARFAPKWDSPGANLAVYSTQHGRGHVNVERTHDRIVKLLRVNVTESRVEAEIVADAGSVRKRFVLSVDLFDEIVPLRSAWSIEFQRAAGSMQMSTGAQIPELQILLRKRWPGDRRWPRLDAAAEDDGVGGDEASPASPKLVWWYDAPGLSPEEAAVLREGTPRTNTPLTCLATSSLYCQSKDACVAACTPTDCPGETLAHSGGRRCVGLPRTGAADGAPLAARFVDADLAFGTVGGLVEWPTPPEAAADVFVLYWAGDKDGPLPGVPEIAEVPAIFADPTSAHELPAGTTPPEGAAGIIIFASNEAGRTLLAATPILDGVRPAPPSSVSFADADPRRGIASGAAKVGAAADEAHVEGYELRWGAEGSDARPITAAELEEPPIAVVPLLKDDSPPSAQTLRLPANGSKVPAGTTWLLAFSIGPGNVRSLPAAAHFEDAAPPSTPPPRVEASKDLDPRAGFATVEVTVWPAVCDKHPRSDGRGREQKCDAGSLYRVYWLHKNGSRIGEPLVESPTSDQRQIFRVEAPVPADAVAVSVVAANGHGETARGTTASFVDDRSELLAVWNPARAAAACGVHGSVSLWFPLGESREVQKLETATWRLRSSVSAVALSSDGDRMLLGQEDGSVTLIVLEAGEWSVKQTVGGPGTVTSMAFDGEKMRMARGAKGGSLDVWRLDDGTATARLRGHEGDVLGLHVDWLGERLASASRDGTVRFWDLRSQACTRTMQIDSLGVERVAVDWPTGRLLTASNDETLRLFEADAADRFAPAAVLEGHAEPVRHLLADFSLGRALSVADDGFVKVWDLSSRECLRTFGGAALGKILAVAVKWEVSQAMLVLADGRVSVVNLEDGEPNGVPTPVGCSPHAAAIAA